MRKYIRPAIKQVRTEEPLMAALSIHDKLGDEQLGNDTSFDTEESSDKPAVNVWD